jgi:hypothetical protein
MALKKHISIFGVQVPSAYIRVENVALSGKTSGVAQLCVYASEPSNGVVSSSAFGFPYDMEGDNPIKQAYEHLKTLPEFAGAADV